MAMLVLVWLLTVMWMMKGTAFTEVIYAQSGKAVLLTPDLPEGKHIDDVRWTHSHLVMSRKRNVLKCHHERCELLTNGSLSFSRVQAEDSGNYSLEVFDENGKLLNNNDFILIVDGSSSSTGSTGSTVAAVVSVLICCFILVIIFIKRRRSQNCATTGPLQENVYVVMHGYCNNKKGKEEEEVEEVVKEEMVEEEEEEEKKKQEKEKQEEESPYVSCNAVVSLETPTTLSVDAEDIYI